MFETFLAGRRPGKTTKTLADYRAEVHLLPFYASRSETEALSSYRASGECICTLCNQEYRRHPFTEHRSWDGPPYLHRLCNGHIVKL